MHSSSADKQRSFDFQITRILPLLTEEEVGVEFLNDLSHLIQERKNMSPEKSHVRRLFDRGFDRIAQKVGEEAIEMVIAAKNNDQQEFVNEAADLLFHFLVLCEAKGVSLQHVVKTLKERKQNKREEN